MTALTAPPPDPREELAALQRTALAIVWDHRDRRDPTAAVDMLAHTCRDEPERMAVVLWILAGWADRYATPPTTRRLLR